MNIRRSIVLGLLLAVITSPVQAGNFPQDFQDATLLYNRGKVEEAREAFLKLVETGPTPAAIDQALAKVADCESKLKRYKEATATVDRIKDKFLLRLCRMRLLADQRKFAEVLSLCKDEDFNAWPDALIYEAYLSRGIAYARTNEIPTAEDNFRQAITKTTSDSEKAFAYLSLAELYTRMKTQNARALETYTEVYKLQAGATYLCRAAIASAKLLATEGKRDLALAELDRLKGLTKQPHWTFAQIGYAEVYTILGSESESKAKYQAIIDSTNPPADALKLAKERISPPSKP
jgi:tetratricopeptide (TPR) repeat protein